MSDLLWLCGSADVWRLFCDKMTSIAGLVREIALLQVASVVRGIRDSGWELETRDYKLFGKWPSL